MITISYILPDYENKFLAGYYEVPYDDASYDDVYQKLTLPPANFAQHFKRGQLLTARDDRGDLLACAKVIYTSKIKPPRIATITPNGTFFEGAKTEKILGAVITFKQLLKQNADHFWWKIPERVRLLMDNFWFDFWQIPHDAQPTFYIAIVLKMDPKMIINSIIAQLDYILHKHKDIAEERYGWAGLQYMIYCLNHDPVANAEDLLDRMQIASQNPVKNLLTRIKEFDPKTHWGGILAETTMLAAGQIRNAEHSSESILDESSHAMKSVLTYQEIMLARMTYPLRKDNGMYP